MYIATVSNADQKVNDKKCVPKKVMSATFLSKSKCPQHKLLFVESLE